MYDTWKVAAASEMGRQHRLLGKNRQDAFFHAARGGTVAIAVADGCGSAAHSEVGAYLGVRAAVRALIDGEDVAAAVRATFVQGLVDEAFLFTLVCARLTPDSVDVWMFGDGIVAIDDEVVCVHEDAPAYLAYGAPPVFERRACAAARVIVATDGCEELDLIALAQGERVFTHPDALRRGLARAQCSDDATLIVAQRNADGVP